MQGEVFLHFLEVAHHTLEVDIRPRVGHGLVDLIGLQAEAMPGALHEVGAGRKVLVLQPVHFPRLRDELGSPFLLELQQHGEIAARLKAAVDDGLEVHALFDKGLARLHEVLARAGQPGAQLPGLRDDLLELGGNDLARFHHGNLQVGGGRLQVGIVANRLDQRQAGCRGGAGGGRADVERRAAVFLQRLPVGLDALHPLHLFPLVGKASVRRVDLLGQVGVSARQLVDGDLRALHVAGRGGLRCLGPFMRAGEVAELPGRGLVLLLHVLGRGLRGHERVSQLPHLAPGFLHRLAGFGHPRACLAESLELLLLGV